MMIKLTFLHTNDIHGRVSQLSRIASLVRQIRRECTNRGEYCLFVDAGDSEDITMLESSLTKGSAMEAILSGAGCDHVALGNAIPIRYGQQAITNLAKHFGHPLLCANMKDGYGNLVEGLQSMAIESFGGLSVAVIGLTAPLPEYSSFFKLQMDQPADLLPELITTAKEQGAKTIILLSHLGSSNDLKLAEQVNGIDLIIGAHDHKELYPPLQVNGTIIVQAGEFGKHLGRIDLTLDPHTGKVIEYQGQLIPIIEDIPLDPQTQAALETEQKRVQEMMDQEVGYLEGAFDLSDDDECESGNLLADALLERMQGAQLSLALAAHWQTGLEAGRLSQGSLFAANRSTANPGKVELTGAQILQFLQEALKPENRSRKLHSLRGRSVGGPHISGAVLFCTEETEDIFIEINGKLLDLNQKYLVATTDMELSDIVGYLVIPDEQVEYEVPTIMPEVLQDYIARHSPLRVPKSRFVTPPKK
jgi:5'-nucleotidase